MRSIAQKLIKADVERFREKLESQRAETTAPCSDLQRKRKCFSDYANFLAWRWAMPTTGFALAGLLLFALGGASLLAQEKRDKVVPSRYSEPTSGAQMYKDYCAVCHGLKGIGDGPAVKSLKAAPPDLGTLAQRNAGQYPAAYVSQVLRSGMSSQSHGTSDMPLWGPKFRDLDTKNVAELRIHNLTTFIESLQRK